MSRKFLNIRFRDRKFCTFKGDCKSKKVQKSRASNYHYVLCLFKGSCNQKSDRPVKIVLEK